MFTVTKYISVINVISVCYIIISMSAYIRIIHFERIDKFLIERIGFTMMYVII